MKYQGSPITLPTYVNCEHCGRRCKVDWELARDLPDSPPGIYALGFSDCRVCQSTGMHLVGDRQFTEAAKRMKLDVPQATYRLDPNGDLHRK